MVGDKVTMLALEALKQGLTVPAGPPRTRTRCDGSLGDAITARRNVREYKPEPVSDDDLNRIAEAGLARGWQHFERRSVGWRMWYGGPWISTHLVTATKPR
jgi:hypothetical protein